MVSPISKLRSRHALRAVAVILAVAASSCAQGGEGDREGDEIADVGGAGGQAMGGFGGSPSGMPAGPGGMSNPGVGGMGGDPGPICEPPEHLCGGICAGNTPATGCYQSMSCDPCPNVPNGTAICDADGFCAATCNSPYVPSGTSCVCPSQCCSDADCSGDATCENGSCVQACDEAACIALCLIQGGLGVCLNNQCTCIM